MESEWRTASSPFKSFSPSWRRSASEWRSVASGSSTPEPSGEHRDQRVGDRENVDQHSPEHELHDAAHLTAIGLTVDHRTPAQKREEHDHRAKTLEERLKQRHDIDERR